MMQHQMQITSEPQIVRPENKEQLSVVLESAIIEEIERRAATAGVDAGELVQTIIRKELCHQ